MLASLSYLQTEAHARVGTLVKERWTLKRLLGVGGMAAVYEATDLSGERKALKIVHQTLLNDENVLQRLRREGRVVNRLTHPGIVPIHEVDRDEMGNFFLVMDLLIGHSLDCVRSALGGKLTERYVRWVAVELLNVLAAAHSRGVLHRDIKPSNLFVTRDGRLRVLDFGVARSKNASSTPSLSLQTAEGSVLGTPTFMSPEQARGRWKEVDERSDLWSVGATLFTLASGRPVHEAENSTEALGLAMTATARPLGDLRPDMDADLVRIIDQALQFKSSDRFASAADMHRALTRGAVGPSRSECPNQLLARDMAGVPLDVTPNPGEGLHTTVGHTKKARTKSKSDESTSHITLELSTEVPESWECLLKSTYWEVYEVFDAKVIVLRRTTAIVDSTASLREENLEVASCLSEKHRGWGGVVDMRLASARGDGKFEQAMGFLRHRLAVHLSRLSVLVSSAAGLLQVSRIDRVDGQSSYVTQDEAEALKFAQG